MIDVLMATYNGEKYVEQQIRSILQQTYRDIHLYIRDDHSTDNTPAILETLADKYSYKITLIKTEGRLGIQQNFSSLMHYSKSDYLMFADQDDVWFPEKVEKSLEKMKTLEKQYGQETPLLVHTDLVVADHQLKPIAPSFWKFTNLTPRNPHPLNRMIVQNVVTGCTMLMNRSLKQWAYPISEHAVMHDWWIALVASAFGQVAHLDAPTLHYRQHGKNNLGAMKYTLMNYLMKDIRRRLNTSFRHTHSLQHAQVKDFYERFQKDFDSRQKEMLKCYLQLPTKGYFLGRRDIIRHRFYKNGFLRLIGSIIFRKQP